MTMDDFKNKTSGAFNSGGGFNGKPAKKAGRILIITVLIGAALVILSGSFYTIREEEQAVVCTLGVPKAVTQSGLHFKIPVIQTVQKVNTTIQGFAIGYSSDSELNYNGAEGADNSMMITSDYNFIHVDFYAEYLAAKISVKIVDSLEEAIDHINEHGSGHTDAIISRDLNSVRIFTTAVDSAAVMVNASTRLHDGGQFGLGAEIGISTDKFHARGPCGVDELTSYKYVVYGDGAIRQ